MRNSLAGMIFYKISRKTFYHKKFSNMASKLLIGFTVGLVAGLLLAPEKGVDSRKKIMRAGRDLKDKFNDFVDGISDKFESFKEEAEDMAQDAKSQARTYASDF
jgi:gas vesicle protein